jgi:hypothetical protein
MSSMLYLRIIFNVLMLGSILFLPWWVTVIVAVGFLLKFSAYEVILWGVFADVLYSSSVISFYNIEFLFTIGAVTMFIIGYFIKKKLMFYDF